MKEIGIPVKINLKTEIVRDFTDKEMMELIVFGTFVKKNDTVYLIYDEVQEKGNIHTIVKFNDKNGAAITRKGLVNMRLSFVENEQKTGNYRTGLGSFLLHTHTEKLAFSWNPELNKGNLDIQYNFFMEEEHVGYYKMNFQFTKVAPANRG